jgi:glucan biosynthesis protein C
MLASLLLRLGALGPLAFYAAIAVGGFMTPGYNHMTQQVSELGQAGAPAATLFNYGMMAAGGAIIVGGLGFFLGMRKLGVGAVMPLLTAVAIGLFGASFVIAGLHPMPSALHGAYHLGYAGIAAPLLAFLSLGDRSEVSGAKTLAVVSFLAGGVLLALLMNVGGLNLVKAADAGLWQRGLILATTLWMVSAFLAIPAAVAARERKRSSAY